MVRGAFGRFVSLLCACGRVLAGDFSRPLLISLRSLRSRWLVTVAVSWVALVIGVVGLVQVSSFFSDLKSLVAFQDTLLKTSVPLDVKNLKLDTHIGVLEDDDPTEAETDAASVANVGFERLVLSDVATLSFDVAYGGDPGDGAANMKGSMIKIAWGDPDDALPVSGYFYLYPSNWTAANIRNDVNNGANASLNKTDDVLDLPMNDGDVYAQGQAYVFQDTDAFLVHASEVNASDGDPANDRSSQTFTFKVAFVRDYAAGSDGNSQLQADFMQFDGRRLHVDVSANSRTGMNRKELELKAKITPTMVAGTTGEAEATKYWGNANAALNITKGSTETVTYVDAASATALDSSGNTFTAAGGTINTLTEAVTVPTSWNGMPVLGSWDVSLAKDQTAMAYYTDSKAGTASKHDLYVAGRQGVLASNANSLFHSFRSISFDLGLLDVCESEDMRYMFHNVQMVRDGFFDISHFRTRNTTTMVEMFHYFGDSAADGVRLKHIDMSYGGFADQSKPNVGAWDTSSVVNTSNMFRYVYYVESIDVTGWDLSQKTNIVLNNMFENAQRLKTLTGLGTWKTDGVSSTASMFVNWATQVTTFTEADVLDLGADTTNGYWNVSRLTAANNMFAGANKIRSIDVTGWDLSAANARSTISTASMFQNTSMLSKIVGIASWKTGGVRYMNTMFQGWCSNAAACAGVTLDLHAQGADVWDMSTVESTFAMFSGATYVTQVNVTGWQTVKVTTMANMFDATTRLCVIPGISGLKTNAVTNVSAMFYRWAQDATCAGVTLDLHAQAGGVWDMSKVTTAAAMFKEATRVEGLDVAGWTFPTLSGTNGGVTLAEMFRSTTMLSSFTGIETWDTTGVWSTSYMFAGWASGVTFSAAVACDLCIPTSGNAWDVTKVTNASYMFVDAAKARTIDATGWQFTAPTNNVNLEGMFQNTYLLETITGISDWPTSSVTNIARMFYQWGNNVPTVSLSITLDAKAGGVWDVSRVTNASYMFYNVDKTHTVHADGWEFIAPSNNVTLNNMFNEATNLQTIDGITSWETTAVTNLSSMFLSWGNGLTAASLNLRTSGDAWDTGRVTTAANMFNNAAKMTHVDTTGWDFSDDTGRTGINLEAMFRDTAKLQEITGITDWPTTGVSNILTMFFQAGDGAQTTLELDLHTNGDSWNVARVTNLGSALNWNNPYTPKDNGTFTGSRFTKIDVTGWDVSLVTTMDSTFKDTYRLAEIDGISEWKTASLVRTQGMFWGHGTSVTYDPDVVNLDLHSRADGSWDTLKLTDTYAMFKNASTIHRIDATGWDFSDTTGRTGIRFEMMFQNTSKLHAVEGITGWTTSGVANVAAMFMASGDAAKTTLELDLHTDGAVWNMARVTNLGSDWNYNPPYTGSDNGMFTDSRFTRIDVTGWDVTNVTTMDSLFKNMYNLTDIAGIGTWSTPSLVRTRSTFEATRVLKKLDLSGFDMSSVTAIDRMFRYTYVLEELKIGTSFIIGVSTSVGDAGTQMGRDVPGYTGKWFRDLHPTDLDTPVNIFAQGTTVAQGTWYPEHTVSLTLDGNWTGKPADPVKAIKYGDASVPTFAKPTRTGWVFEGYWTGKGAADGEVTGDQVVDDTGAYVDAIGYVTSGIGWTRYADTTLYAKWKEATYSITVNLTRNETTAQRVNVWLDSDGVSGDETYTGAGGYWRAASGTYNSFVIIGVPYTKTKGKVMAEYIDAGTYNLTTGAHTATSTGQGTAVTVATYAANVTSAQTHALKIAQLYSITYSRSTTPSGASGTLPSAQTKIHGTAITLGTNNSTVTGYTKNGWYTTATGAGGTAYANGASYATNAALTLYEAWIVKTNVITLDSQGATSAGTTGYTATFGTTAPALTAPTKTGQTFEGYYSAVDGGGVQVLTSAMEYPTTVAGFVNTGRWARTDEAAVTLYAKWTVTVAFKSYDGASDVLSSVVLEPGSNYTIPAAPAVMNQVFVGWAETANVSRITALYTDAANTVRAPLSELDRTYIGNSKGTELTNVTAHTTLHAVYLKTLAGTSTPSESAPENQEFIWANAVWRVLAADGPRRLVLKATALTSLESGMGTANNDRPYYPYIISRDTFFSSSGSNGYEDSGGAPGNGIRGRVDYYCTNYLTAYDSSVLPVTLNNPTLSQWNSCTGNSLNWDSYPGISDWWTSSCFATTVGSGAKQAFQLSYGDINSTPGMGLSGKTSSALLRFTGDWGYYYQTNTRSFGGGSTYSGAVSGSGELDRRYNYLQSDMICARPALWLTL
ncbi:MAG: BspA family leucine-rich repeat surface protein [Bifidobacterium sp.]|uniref:BspA family leucine-rich repeat surface protein n=1 Tax=Bifidobacterium sp. TaxID=41200 RepID=UPI0039EB43BB